MYPSLEELRKEIENTGKKVWVYWPVGSSKVFGYGEDQEWLLSKGFKKEIVKLLDLPKLAGRLILEGIINKARELGWEVTGFTTQVKFLLGLGIQQEIENIERICCSPLEMLKNKLAIQSLIALEGGLGETFKVLILHKGLNSPKLDGFKYEV